MQKDRNKAEHKTRNWREIADEVFTFARYAKEDFDSDDIEKKRSVIIRLGESLSILDRTIQFTPNKYFVPIEKMNESLLKPSDLVRTDSLQIESPAFQHGSPFWLPFIQTVRTEHYTYDPLRMRQIRELVDDFEAGNLDQQEKSHANV